MIDLSPEQKRSPTMEPMLPLINVVFLLLVFFLLAGKINSSQLVEVEHPKHQLPAEEGTGTPDEWLYLDASAQLHYGDSALSLAELNRHEWSEDIVLSADARLTVEQISPVLAKLQSLGVGTVSLISEKVDSP